MNTHPIVLIRHGQSWGNEAHRWLYDERNIAGYVEVCEREIFPRHEDPWLTELGFEQAQALVPSLNTLIQDWPTPAVFTSPLARAQQTTAHALPSHEDVTVEDALQERWWGSLEYPTPEFIDSVGGIDGLQQQVDQFFVNPHLAPEGGETLLEKLENLKPFVEKITKQAENQPVLVVCHGEVIRCLNALLGADEDPGASIVSFAGTPNCGFHMYAQEEGRWIRQDRE